MIGLIGHWKIVSKIIYYLVGAVIKKILTTLCLRTPVLCECLRVLGVIIYIYFHMFLVICLHTYLVNILLTNIFLFLRVVRVLTCCFCDVLVLACYASAYVLCLRAGSVCVYAFPTFFLMICLRTYLVYIYWQIFFMLFLHVLRVLTCCASVMCECLRRVSAYKLCLCDGSACVYAFLSTLFFFCDSFARMFS